MCRDGADTNLHPAGLWFGKSDSNVPAGSICGHSVSHFHWGTLIFQLVSFFVVWSLCSGFFSEFGRELASQLFISQLSTSRNGRETIFCGWLGRYQLLKFRVLAQGIKVRVLTRLAEQVVSGGVGFEAGGVQFESDA